MPLTMHEIAAPAFLQMLHSLSAILDKAAEHAQASGVDPAELIGSRLAPDMLPFSKQVQIATDHAKGAIARLAGRDVPKFEDTESTVAELKARLAKTMAFIDSVEPVELEGSEDRQVTLRIAGREMSFTGRQYLQNFALPNFYFHVTTAYAILRHKGVPLGKADYIGRSALG